MRTPLQTITAAVLILFSGGVTIAQETRAPENGPMLQFVFFLSNALAPDHSLLSSRVIFAGDLDGDGRDEIIGDHLQQHHLYLYTFRNGALEPTASIPTDGGISAGVVADVDGDSRKEGVSYEARGHTFVMIRQDARGGLSRTAFQVSVDSQPDVLVAGKFFDPKREALAMDVMWKGAEEVIYDDLTFFTWDGKGFRQGSKVRLMYNITGLVASDLDGNGWNEFLVLGDEIMQRCHLEIYHPISDEAAKWLVRYPLPLDGCRGTELILLRAGGRPYLFLIEGSKIYEAKNVRLPTVKIAPLTLELRATLHHMEAHGVAAGDIDGDGDQELLIVASRPRVGPPDTGFFIYKFFPQ